MCSEQTYKKIKIWFTSKNYRLRLLTFVYKMLPLVVFISYPILLLYLTVTRDGRILQSITVPLGVFVTLTLIRKFLNFERPYEKYNIEPIFQKNTKGLSFPSRHTASAAVIAMTFLYINPLLGGVFLAISALIAVSRICSGVHFPRDVIAGFLYSVVLASVFFYVL